MNASILSRLTALAAGLSTVLAMCAATAALTADTHEMRDRDAELLVPFDAAELPYSFVYDGQPSSVWLKPLSKESTRKGESKRLDEVRTQSSWTWTDPKTGLQVRCVAVYYEDFPVIEHTLYFKNTGKQDTPILKDVKALDIRVPTADGKASLHYNRGTTVKPNDFEPLTAELAVGKPLALTPKDGRPSGGVWPYFNLKCGDEGRIIVVGWPGKWAATFDLQADKQVRVTAGQELVNLKLHPGEEIRTPLVVQMLYRGDVTRAQNQWRRWMLAHGMPRPGGKLPAPQLNACSSHQFVEMTRADEASQKLFIDRYREEGIKLDYWWMDAGWYSCGGEWWNTGTWEVDKTRFPKGLRAVSDHARKRGIKTIVWFEPERVDPKTWLYDNHRKDWLLGDTLLDLGNPQALAWAIDHFNKFIDEQGIDLYRQDFNIDPLPYWRKNDAADRQGITENKYVCGYLAYWDGLLAKHPNLLIDSCASGGRRNDLETLRRSVPLLRSDCIFDSLAHQGHTYGLAQWLPFFGTGELVLDVYAFRSTMCASHTACWDVRYKNLDYDLMRKLVREWRAVSPCYLGDYYPLTPYSLDKAQWMAWQFDLPEKGEGLVQAFRREECKDAAKAFRLQGLDADATYEVLDFDAGTPTRLSGDDLMAKGLIVEIKNKRGAAVIRYRKVK